MRRCRLCLLAIMASATVQPGFAGAPPPAPAPQATRVAVRPAWPMPVFAAPSFTGQMVYISATAAAVLAIVAPARPGK